MKWITHQAVALGTAYALHMPHLALPAIFIGSILPDILDQRVAALFPNRQKAFKRIHRGTTHWFGWWLGLLLLAVLLAGKPQAAVLGLGFGGLMHVALDMCTTSGTPIFPWGGRARVSLKLCSTGSLREYLFLFSYIAVFVFFEGKDAAYVILSRFNL